MCSELNIKRIVQYYIISLEQNNIVILVKQPLGLYNTRHNNIIIKDYRTLMSPGDHHCLSELIRIDTQFVVVKRTYF